MTNKSTFAWPERTRGAVSITYDDALPCHYEYVVPAWEAYALHVTCYTNINALMNDPDVWRDVAVKGHELGNHSIFHPCRKEKKKDSCQILILDQISHKSPKRPSKRTENPMVRTTVRDKKYKSSKSSNS